MMRGLIALTALAIPMASQALVLNANATSNNGTGGIFMDDAYVAKPERNRI